MAASNGRRHTGGNRKSQEHGAHSVTAKVVDSIDPPTLQGFVRGNIEKGTEIFTADLNALKDELIAAQEGYIEIIEMQRAA